MRFPGCAAVLLLGCSSPSPIAPDTFYLLGHWGAPGSDGVSTSSAGLTALASFFGDSLALYSVTMGVSWSLGRPQGSKDLVEATRALTMAANRLADIRREDLDLPNPPFGAD